MNWKHLYCIPTLLVFAVLVGGCASSSGPKAQPASRPLARISLPESDAGQRAMAQVMSGEFALQAGDRKSAAQAYRQAAELSADPRVVARAARLLLETGDAEAADRAIAKLELLHAEPQLVAEVRARKALEHGHRQEAAEQLAVILATGDRDAWGSFAELLSSARDPALAGLLLEQLVTPANLPDADPSIWVAMSQLGEKLGRHSFARSTATAAASHFESAETLGWAAHLAYVNGDNAEGKRLYQLAIDAAPNLVAMRRAYAGALAEDGEFRQAGEVLAGGPQTLETFAARAAYAAQSEDQARLLKVYHDLLDAAPRLDQSPDFLLGRLADSLDRTEDAIAWYAAVPLTDPAAFEARARRAVLLDQSGQHQVALDQVRQLQELAEDEDEIRRAFQAEAFLHAQSNHSDQALAAYDRGLAKLPGDVELRYGRALTRADMGDIDGAIADLRQVIEAQPDNIEAVNALGYTLADSKRDLQESRKLLERALAARPEQAAIIDSWGWLQYRLGNLAEAAEYLERAFAMQPDPEIGAHLAEVWWQSGKQEEARELLAELREKHPQNKVLEATAKRLMP